MLNLTPGVRTASASIKGSEDAASRAVALAEESEVCGSFGVGGILVDLEGRLIAEATNAVIRNWQVQDPTAHVERQLVDWYYQIRETGFNVPPERLIIVSSLDPCAMCAGAISAQRA